MQFELAVSLNHDVMTFLTPQVTQNTKIRAKECGYDCLRLLLYAHRQHMNVLKQFVYVSCGCRKQFELAVSLNHDIITSL
jgi:hypothetical protein